MCLWHSIRKNSYVILGVFDYGSKSSSYFPHLVFEPCVYAIGHEELHHFHVSKQGSSMEWGLAILNTTSNQKLTVSYKSRGTELKKKIYS